MTTTRTASASSTGCSGTFRTRPTAGHGANANIFTSIVATYTDNAQGAADALTGQDDVVLHPKPQAGRVLRLDRPRRRQPGGR